MSEILGRGMKLAARRKTITVEVPDMECSVRLRALSAGQSQNLTPNVIEQLALMIVDESGERIYTTDEEIQELGELSVAAVQILVKEAASLNGISKEAVEDAIKNYQASRNGASVSA